MGLTANEQKALIRKWYEDYLVRGPKQGELDWWAAVFDQEGAEAVFRGIVGSDEGKAVRAKRRAAIGL